MAENFSTAHQHKFLSDKRWFLSHPDFLADAKCVLSCRLCKHLTNHLIIIITLFNGCLIHILCKTNFVKFKTFQHHQTIINMLAVVQIFQTKISSVQKQQHAKAGFLCLRQCLICVVENFKISTFPDSTVCITFPVSQSKFFATKNLTFASARDVCLQTKQ